MRHLDRATLLTVVDGGSVGSAAQRHLEACGPCREEVGALQGVLRDLRGVEVPEPSPLFWDRFSARVREAVRESPPARRWRWLPRGPGLRWWAHAGALTAVVGVLLVGVQAPSPPAPAPPSPAMRVAAEPRLAAADEAADETADAWEMMLAVADGESWDDEQVAAFSPSVADGAALELSDDEQAELARLLLGELDQPAS